MSKKIGIVGTGNMGGGMAKRLLDLGWLVFVHDLDTTKQSALQAAGAQACAHAAALAQAAEVVIVCVIDASQVQQVFDGPHGLLAGLTAGQTAAGHRCAHGGCADVGRAHQSRQRQHEPDVGSARGCIGRPRRFIASFVQPMCVDQSPGRRRRPRQIGQ